MHDAPFAQRSYDTKGSRANGQRSEIWRSTPILDSGLDVQELLHKVQILEGAEAMVPRLESFCLRPCLLQSLPTGSLPDACFPRIAKSARLLDFLICRSGRSD